MLWVPQKGRLRYETNAGAVGTGNPGTAVTTGASVSTKGTPSQLIASTAFDTYWMRVVAHNYSLSSGAASQGSLDILIGSSTESVLIANLLMGYSGGSGPNRGPKVWDFPIYIPAGSRLSAQAAGNRTSTAMRVVVNLYGGYGYPPFRVGTKVTTYGMSTVPDGTSIIPGASGAVGSFSQITSSTSEDHFALVPSFQLTNSTNVSFNIITVEIGSGSSAEEVISLPYWFATDTSEAMDGPYNPMPTFQDIPAGTRLAMRASASGTINSYNGVIHALS